MGSWQICLVSASVSWIGQDSIKQISSADGHTGQYFRSHAGNVHWDLNTVGFLKSQDRNEHPRSDEHAQYRGQCLYTILNQMLYVADLLYACPFVLCYGGLYHLEFHWALLAMFTLVSAASLRTLSTISFWPRNSAILAGFSFISFCNNNTMNVNKT